MERWDRVIVKMFEYSKEEEAIYSAYIGWKHYVIVRADEERFLNWKSYQSVWAGYSCNSKNNN